MLIEVACILMDIERMPLVVDHKEFVVVNLKARDDLDSFFNVVYSSNKFS